MIRRRWIDTPYEPVETVGFLVRSLVGSSRRHARGPGAPPRGLLDPSVRPELRIALVGDLLPTRGRRLELDDALAAFVRDADLVVANLEGPIAFAAYRPPHPLARLDPRSWFVLGHDDRILEDLARLAPPSHWLLGLANNHAADFGERGFERTRRRLREAGFHHFGAADAPSFRLPGAPVELVAATQWANVRNDLVAAWTPGRSPGSRSGPEAFRIFYPHWSYEFEHHPRPRFRRLAGELLAADFDALVGHHSHVVQPLEVLPGGRLVAYSLGNLNWSLPIRREARAGAILRLTLGPGRGGRWALRGWERRRTWLERSGPRLQRVVAADGGRGEETSR